MTKDYEPVDFRDWLRANPEYPEFVVCARCNGVGELEERECECDECGHTHYVYDEKCPNCRGERKVPSEEARKAYGAQVASDRARWTLLAGAS